MRLELNTDVGVTFTTHNPTTKALADADVLPTGTVIRNGTPDGPVAVTIEKTGTGRYKAGFTIPDTYADSDTVELYIAATVAGVAGGGIVWRGMIDVALSQTYAAIMGHRTATEQKIDILSGVVALGTGGASILRETAYEHLPKTGYKLAGDGLDAIADDPAVGPATTLPQRINQLWRRLFGKAVLDKTTGTLTTYAADGVTPLTEQAVAETETTQTIEAAAAPPAP